MQQKATTIEEYSIKDLDLLIESIRKQKGLNEEEIAASLKYNPGYIAQTRSRGKVSIKFIQALQSLLNTGLQNAKEGLPERSLNNLTESNRILAEANKTLAEANKTLAEANHVISKNHDELIQLTKMIVSSSNKRIVSEGRPASNRTKEIPASQGDLSLDRKYSKGKNVSKDS